MFSVIYKLREAKRRLCFDKGICYVNEYRGGIKEYICLIDKHPCLFQCMQMAGQEQKDVGESVTISEGDYKVEGG